MNARDLIVTRISDHVGEIRSFLDGLTDAQLLQRPDNGTWSLSEIAHHIVTVQEQFVEVVTRILIEDYPKLDRFCLDEHSEENHLDISLRPRLSGFEEQRKNLVSLLVALTEEQWKREGGHPDIPHFTVEKSMEQMMRHEESHLYEMYRLFFCTKNSS